MKEGKGAIWELPDLRGYSFFRMSFQQDMPKPRGRALLMEYLPARATFQEDFIFLVYGNGEACTYPVSSYSAPYDPRGNPQATEIGDSSSFSSRSGWSLSPAREHHVPRRRVDGGPPFTGQG